MFLNDDDLKALLGPASSPTRRIDPYVEERVESAAYELTVGKEYYTTNNQTDVKTLLQANQQFTIEPGQFALLITEEYIKIPDDKLGFISIKAGVKFAGLINVSGFHVDPGYEGKLKFSVYNAGSRPITLAAGQPLFPLWIAEFNNPLQKPYKGVHKGQTNISPEDVNKMAGIVLSPAVLNGKLTELKNSFENLNTQRFPALESNFTGARTFFATFGGIAVTLLFLIISKYVFVDYALMRKDLEKQDVFADRLHRQDSVINVLRKNVARQDSLLKSNFVKGNFVNSKTPAN